MTTSSVLSQAVSQLNFLLKKIIEQLNPRFIVSTLNIQLSLQFRERASGRLCFNHSSLHADEDAQPVSEPWQQCHREAKEFQMLWLLLACTFIL